MRLGVWEGGPQNFTEIDVLLAIGYNPMVSSYAPFGGLQGTDPFATLRRRKAEGLKLIVIDPRHTELARQADIHLQVKPGEDPALLAGMLNVILSEGRPFDQILRETSANADVILLGLAAPGEDDRFSDYYTALRERTEGLPATLFVLAAEGVAFGQVLE